MAGLPVYPSEDSSVIAIAGDWYSDGHGLVSRPLAELQPIAQIAGVRLAAKAAFCPDVEERANTAIFVFDGGLGVQREQNLLAPGLAVFDGGDTLYIEATAQGTRCLVFAGAPISEPVVGYGPFLMNTREEIEIALKEYRDGTFLTH